MRRAELARRIETAWYGDGWAGGLAAPLGWLFGAVVRARRWAYGAGWLRVHRVGVPVIVVGNITVGGAGKTPLVIWLADRLHAGGHRPGVVSRGYGGRMGRGPHLVAPGDDAAAVGDEALLLARRAGCPVCVGSDRVAAARSLAARGATVIVADDGLQHYRLHRDREIVVVDGERGLGNGRLLPAGPLREPATRLQAADLIVTNGGGNRSGPGFTLQPGAAVNLANGDTRSLESWRGQTVRAVAGIGNPARFHGLLAAAGLRVVPVTVADHGRVDLAALAAESGDPVLMTEKDAVKYPRAPGNCWYLPVRLVPGPDMESAVARLLQDLPPGPAPVAVAGAAS